MSFSQFNKTDESSFFMGDRMESDESAEPPENMEIGEKIEENKSTFENDSLEVAPKKKYDDATYTVAKSVTEIPHKPIRNVSEEFTMINSDRDNSTNENIPIGQTFVVEKSGEQKLVVVLSQDTLNRTEWNDEITENVTNEKMNNSVTRCQEELANLRATLRRSMDFLNVNNSNFIPSPKSSSKLDSFTEQKASEDMLDLSETRKTFAMRTDLTLTEETTNVLDEKMPEPVLELSETKKFGQNLFETPEKHQSYINMLDQKTPEALLDLSETRKSFTTGSHHYEDDSMPFTSKLGLRQISGIATPISNRSTGLLAPIPTGGLNRSTTKIHQSNQKLSTTMELARNMEVTELGRHSNMSDSRFDPNNIELEEMTYDKTVQDDNVQNHHPNYEENISLIADTRPDPLSMLTFLGDPKKLSFTHSNLQEPDEPDLENSTFLRYPHANTSQPSQFIFEKSALSEKVESKMENIEELEETEESIHAKKEVTMQIESLATEFQDLINDFREINTETYKKINFLSSSRMDKTEIQVLEAFEYLAKARLLYRQIKKKSQLIYTLYLMSKNANEVLNDHAKSEKIALYLKIKELVSKKRILVQSTISKADQLLQSGRKNNFSSEKKFEKWMKMGPEDRETFDKKEDAIIYAMFAVGEAVGITIKNLLATEERENKNEKYMKIANKYLQH